MFWVSLLDYVNHRLQSTNEISCCLAQAMQGGGLRRCGRRTNFAAVGFSQLWRGSGASLARAPKAEVGCKALASDANLSVPNHLENQP